MNKLIHPGTAFLQALPYTEVAFKDMTPMQQKAVWRYMFAEGDGYWGEFPSIAAAVEALGDVRFGVGSFANDDTMKLAFVSCVPNELVDEDDPIGFFNGRYIGHECEAEAIPVVLGNSNVCADFGMLDDGYNEFYDHWVKLSATEFVRVLPGWNTDDNTGRGGQ